MKPLCVYIHIPFCLSKCAYCDFLSFSGSKNHAGYIETLCREIANSAAKLAGYSVRTIYFGGGTPTVLETKGLVKIKKTIEENYRVESGAEITIEANPETCGVGMTALGRPLVELRNAGFNRISIGVQSWCDVMLRRLGRVHSAENAEAAFWAARNAGFDNISLDLMFSLPSQSLDDWKFALNKTINLAPEHISCYGLTVEDGTPLAKESDLQLPSDELDRKMYYMARKAFRKAGYSHYEISNFAKPGKHSRHNTNYWTGGDYIGFGLGAHSLVNSQRFSNIENFDEYIACHFSNDYVAFNHHNLTRCERMEEFMFLGLRLMGGISESQFMQTFNESITNVYGKQIENFVKQGLLRCENGRVALTETCIDVCNKIFTEFLQ